MNKIERKRVKHAKANLNAKIDHLAAQLKTAQEQLRLARHDRAIAESTLEGWRKKLQAIHHHIAVLNPEYMWQLMSTGLVGEDAFSRDMINTMYKKVLQITD